MNDRPPLTVQVLFFAQARERAGCAARALALPAGSRVSDALVVLAREHTALGPLWPHLAVAVDGVLARPDLALGDGAELALLPPVSGG